MKNTVCLIVTFTIIWIILTESFAFWSVAAGIAISAGCALCCHKLLFKAKITENTNVSLLRFSVYALYLIGQIYLAGFAAIKLIITGAKVDIVEINTEIESDFLKVMLANSITLTPGTLTLELKDDRITVLWLRDKMHSFEEVEDEDEIIKGGMERMLRKAQR